MRVQLLIVPYDSGVRGWRMGAGPEHLLRIGLVEHLQSGGHEVQMEVLVDDGQECASEVRTTFGLMQQVATRVRRARAARQFPLVLSGNCNTACGALSGLTPQPRAVFWFDAHGDLNTPSTTVSGFLDGMALAVVQGLCWEGLTATIPGFEPVPPARVSLLGARDLDPPEVAWVARSGIAHLSPGHLASELPALLARPALAACVAYLHCDLDVLDPGVGQVNSFPAAGGLSVPALTSAVRAIGAAIPLGAAAVTAYAPEFDMRGTVGRAALEVVDAILAAAP
jgi:arginase